MIEGFEELTSVNLPKRLIDEITELAERRSIPPRELISESVADMIIYLRQSKMGHPYLIALYKSRRGDK